MIIPEEKKVAQESNHSCSLLHDMALNNISRSNMTLDIDLTIPERWGDGV